MSPQFFSSKFSKNNVEFERKSRVNYVQIKKRLSGFRTWADVDVTLHSRLHQVHGMIDDVSLPRTTNTPEEEQEKTFSFLKLFKKNCSNSKKNNSDSNFPVKFSESHFKP